MRYNFIWRLRLLGLRLGFGLIERWGGFIFVLLVEVIIGVDDDVFGLAAEDVVNALLADHLDLALESLKELIRTHQIIIIG